MAGAPITTLFTEVSAPGQGPSGVAVSFLIHCVLIGGSFYTIRHTPRIQEPNLIDEVPVRLLTLNRPVNVYRDFGVFSHPAPRKTTPVPKPQPTGGGQMMPTVRPRLELRIEHAPQTLVDPLRKPDVVVKIPTPLPNVVLWKPEPIMVKEVQPTIEVPTTAPVKSSMTPPNHEPDLADVQVASTPNATEKPALAPSTTSPVTSVKPAPIQQAPQTSSAADKPPAPVALVSITEFRMDKGTTALPPANQVASSRDPVSMQPGKVALGAAEPSKTQAAPKDGIGTGKQPGEHGDQTGKGTATVAPAAVAAVAAPAAVAPAKVQAPATDSGSAINNPQTRVATKSATNDKTMPADDVENGVHVSLPPDGRYGAIVVGGSLSDMFPETDGIMTDRLTYTVYLQVGLPRAWIMQYSLPESSEHGINTIRPEAPFPYEIFRPKISPGEITTDAILVHGLVNKSGHFEQLDIVYPHRYAKAKSFLANMERWQFRPATQQGIPTTVEVLLIIPVN